MKARPKSPRVIVVTGASAGVGRAVVREFAASEAAHLGLLARGNEGLEGAKADVERLGGRAIAIPTDVADYAQVESAAQKIEEAFGPIDVWVNVAMTTVFSPVLDLEPEEVKRVTEVTYLGSAYGAIVALKRMVPRDHGCIVQVGSALAFRSIPLQAVYCGAKHGIIGFIESIRTELIHYGSNVRVTAVHLPGMNTPQFSWCRSHVKGHPQPVPPIYQPEVAARAIAWSSRHRRREIYVGLPTVLSIFGNQFIPGLLDFYLGKTGFSAQQAKQPLNDKRADNLFEPASGDYGAHGAFDTKAHTRSIQTWITENRAWLGLGVLAAISATFPLWRGTGGRAFSAKRSLTSAIG